MKHSKQVDNYAALKVSMTLDDFPKIKGINFEEGVNLKNLLKSFSTTGIQATNLAKAIAIVKTMRREGSKIYIAFTSNMITCGVREIITYLTKHKIVEVLVTPAGGVEEDIIKSLKPIAVGEFSADDEWLFSEGINRTGNMFIPNDRYLEFEKFMNPIFKELFETQKVQGPSTALQLTSALGKHINAEESYLFWAHKNNIPVYCPALTDGSIGDLLYFMKQRHPTFHLDITQDMYDIVNEGLNAEKVGVIILGGGVAKHHVLNSLMFREGADYAVYINTGQEFDASDSGARTSEAITWGKIKPNALHVKVHGDASILFPLLIAGVLSKD